MNEEDELLAAEYALGTLHRDERTLFANMLARDPDLREAVAAWERRLAPLSETLEPVAPPADVWKRLEATLATTPRDGDEDETFDDEERDVPTLQAALARWRLGALFAGAAAACLAGLLIFRELMHPAIQPNYVAVVNRGGALPALIVRVDLASGEVYVRPVATETPAGKSLELWYVDEGKSPESMGLVPVKAATLRAPPGLSPQKAGFAVTVEPMGGSTTGGPTGPIVYSGQLFEE